MFLTTNDLIYIIFITISGSLGILTNCLLLYLIVWESPPYLTPYRIFLSNTAITQLLYSASMILIEPRIISADMSIVIVYLGPAQYFGPWWCYMLYIIMLHFAVNSFISIMLSMVFRCISLRTLGFPVSGAYFMCLLGYIIPFTMVIGVINMEYVSDAETNNWYIHNSVPDLDKYLTAVGTKVDQLCVLWVIFCVSFMLLPIYVVMYFCRWKIYRMISRPTYVQNNSTKNNIRRLVKALTVQSIIPLFTVFPSSVSYISTQFGIIETHMYSYFIISCLSVASLVDPIVTIYYVNPYRRFIRRCLGLSVPEKYNTILGGTSVDKSRSSSFRRSMKKSRSNLFKPSNTIVM